MKKATIIICLCLLSSCFYSFSQEKVKFGEIPVSDLEMTVYAKDSSASAVILYEERDTRYDIRINNLYVRNYYCVRIKILTNDGLSYANASVDQYVASTRDASESLTGLSGNTYNLVDGKIEKTKLSKEHIFEEKISDNLIRTKFAFQAVKPGSIIEYKYEILSPQYWNLDDCIFQRSIPVRYSKYDLQVPEYFSFSKETKGMEPVKSTIKKENQSWVIQNQTLNFACESMLFETQDLPALKDEDYIWSLKDYMTRVTFELRSIQIPGSVYKDFSNSWVDVDRQLMADGNFGKQFKNKYFTDAELDAVAPSNMPAVDRIRAIYNLVRSKVKWNDLNAFWAKNSKDAFKKGLGTSGEINAILIASLSQAGLVSYPVVMSLRNIGRLPITHATIDNLNYFVVGAEVDDKQYYMDASSKYGDLNVMATGCLSDMAHSVRNNSLSDWVNLSKITKSVDVKTIDAKFNENGILSGKVIQTQNNQLAYSFRKDYVDYKDQQEYIEKRQTSDNIEIQNFEIRNLENTADNLGCSFDFEKNEVMLGEDHLYFNPLIFPMLDENPFKAEERKLPVEFAFSLDRRIISKIEIPKGYVVEEIPQPTKVSLNEGGDASFMYHIENKDNVINVSLKFTLNRVIFGQNEYKQLRDFYSYITTQSGAQVVLKKVQ